MLTVAAVQRDRPERNSLVLHMHAVGRSGSLMIVGARVGDGGVVAALAQSRTMSLSCERRSPRLAVGSRDPKAMSCR